MKNKQKKKEQSAEQLEIIDTKMQNISYQQIKY